MVWLEKAGITDDFTIGYPDVAGFRLGTSRPVHWINPENKREKLVCLSEKGKEAANSLKDIMDQWEKIIFAGITPQEEQVLEQIMGKIVGNVREYERNIGREKL